MRYKFITSRSPPSAAPWPMQCILWKYKVYWYSMVGWLHISWQDISTSDLPNILFLSLDMINCIFYGFKPNKIDAWYSIEYVSQYIDNVILYMDFCILYYICSTESRLYRRIQYRSLRWSWWGKQAGMENVFSDG